MPGLKPVALTKPVVLTKPLALIALVMLLTGCATPAYPWAGIRGAAGAAAGGPSSSGGAQTAEPMASSDEMPADGGTLYLSMFSAPRGVFNPILMEDGYDATIVGLVFAGLLTRTRTWTWSATCAKALLCPRITGSSPSACVGTSPGTTATPSRRPMWHSPSEPFSTPTTPGC